jgi:hypothetical protein
MQMSYRQQLTFIGALVGAVLGALGVLMYLDYAADQELADTKEMTLGFSDMARLGAATFALVRQINEIANRAEEVS